jgi:small-conductance mechanosensitive channel
VEAFGSLFDKVYFGNTLWKWTVAAAIVVGVFLLLLLIRRLVRSNYERFAQTAKAELLEMPLKIASRTAVPFLFFASLFAGLQALQLQPKAAAVIVKLFTIAAFWQVGLWISAGVLAWVDRKQQHAMATDRAAASSIGIIGFMARIVIWAFVLLLTLDNLGIEIKPLLAGLGIGGIAVALAVQNVLGDLLASLSIALDKPFVVGDAIAVDNFNGTVEQIGIKSVRVRSVTGEQIIMPNADLLKSRVRNYGRMQERRIVLNVAVDLATPRDKLAKIPGLLKTMIEQDRDARFDRCHFARLTPSAAEFEAVFFVLTPNYTRYMDIQQRINFAIIETFDTERIQFAQSVQKLLLEGGGAALEAQMSEGRKTT